MEKKKKSAGERLESFFAGKGFYIVLFICVAVIGVSAWVMLANGRTTVDNEAEIKTAPQASSFAAPTPTVPPAIAPTAPVVPEAGPVDLSEPGESDQEPEVSETDTEDTAQENTAAAPEDESEESEETAVWTQEEMSAAVTFIWPVEGEIEIPFSVSALLYNRTMSDWRTHDGIDIAAELGAVVMACAGGRIERIYTDDLYGVTVVIDHSGGLRSIYSNLAEMPTVLEGDSVMIGEVIGSIGDTALAESGEVTHLHFAMTQDGNPVDPIEYLPER